MRGLLALCWNIGPRWVHVFAAKKKSRLSTLLRLCRSDLQNNTEINGIKFKRGYFDKIDWNTWTPDWDVNENKRLEIVEIFIVYKGSFWENNIIKRQNQGLFYRNVGSKDIWNFLLESWVDPFKNMQMFRL